MAQAKDNVAALPTKKLDEDLIGYYQERLPGAHLA